MKHAILLLISTGLLVASCGTTPQKKQLEFSSGLGAWGSGYDTKKDRFVYEPETEMGSNLRIVYFQYTRLYDSLSFKNLPDGYRSAYIRHLAQYAQEHPYLDLISVESVRDGDLEVGHRTYWKYNREKDTTTVVVQVWPPDRSSEKTVN